MTGYHLCESTCDGDTSKVSTLMSAQDSQSFINFTSRNGHVAVTEKIIDVNCNVDLRLIMTLLSNKLMRVRDTL